MRRMNNEEFKSHVGKFLKRYGRVKTLENLNSDESSRVLPFIVENQEQKFAVFAFHWKKSIGTNTVIKIEHQVSEMNCDGAIVIGSIFSQNSYDMVQNLNEREQTRIILIKRDEMNEILRNASR